MLALLPRRRWLFVLALVNLSVGNQVAAFNPTPVPVASLQPFIDCINNITNCTYLDLSGGNFPFNDFYQAYFDVSGSLSTPTIAPNSEDTSLIASGTIPTEIGLLTQLTFLSFLNNALTGSIPTEMALLTNIPAIFSSTDTDTDSNTIDGVPTEGLYVQSVLEDSGLCGMIPAGVYPLDIEVPQVAFGDLGFTGNGPEFLHIDARRGTLLGFACDAVCGDVGHPLTIPSTSSIYFGEQIAGSSSISSNLKDAAVLAPVGCARDFLAPTKAYKFSVPKEFHISFTFQHVGSADASFELVYDTIGKGCSTDMTLVECRKAEVGVRTSWYNTQGKTVDVYFLQTSKTSSGGRRLLTSGSEFTFDIGPGKDSGDTCNQNEDIIDVRQSQSLKASSYVKKILDDCDSVNFAHHVDKVVFAHYREEFAFRRLTRALTKGCKDRKAMDAQGEARKAEARHMTAKRDAKRLRELDYDGKHNAEFTHLRSKFCTDKKSKFLSMKSDHFFPKTKVPSPTQGYASNAFPASASPTEAPTSETSAPTSAPNNAN